MATLWSPSELRLLSEWLDIGAQYFNDPFTAPGELMSRSLTPLTFLCLLLLFAAGVQAKEPAHKILIADPFIELHSGPGRGYPIFHVVERGREVELVKRRTDWFQLRTDQGVVGWASRDQMVATLEPTGEPLDLQEPARENYMSRRWQGRRRRPVTSTARARSRCSAVMPSATTCRSS